MNRRTANKEVDCESGLSHGVGINSREFRNPTALVEIFKSLREQQRTFFQRRFDLAQKAIDVPSWHIFGAELHAAWKDQCSAKCCGELVEVVFTRLVAVWLAAQRQILTAFRAARK